VFQDTALITLTRRLDPALPQSDEAIEPIGNWVWGIGCIPDYSRLLTNGPDGTSMRIQNGRVKDITFIEGRGLNDERAEQCDEEGGCVSRELHDKCVFLGSLILEEI